MEGKLGRKGTIIGKISEKDWIWPFLLGAAITYASSRQIMETPPGFHFDKVAHFFVFGLFATLLYRFPAEAFKKQYKPVYAIVLTALFGLSDEWCQYSQPVRYFEMGDIAADFMGALTAVAAYRYWTFYRNLLEKELFQFTRLWLGLKSILKRQ